VIFYCFILKEGTKFLLHCRASGDTYIYHFKKEQEVELGKKGFFIRSVQVLGVSFGAGTWGPLRTFLFFCYAGD
jgi:hypothetical protein